VELYILDRRGRPIIEPDARRWNLLNETDPRCQLGYSEWEAEQGLVIVETLFRGHDLRRKEDRSGRPALWDTVAFLVTRGDVDEIVTIEQWLYQSRPAAMRGHEQLVRRLSGGGGLEPPGGNQHLSE
jgi:hypothetical protein